MIKKLRLNVNKTYELYLKSKDIIEDGHCYNNCINILAKLLLEEYKNGEYKIGYCYVGGKDHILVRHCVIITKNNEILDVSALLRYDFNELEELIKIHEIKYFVFAELNCNSLYIALSMGDCDPTLKEILKSYEKEMYDYAIKLGLEFNEHDYNMFIKPQ